MTNAQTLDEHRHTGEQLKGDEVLCMMNLDVPTIYIFDYHQRMVKFTIAYMIMS